MVTTMRRVPHLFGWLRHRLPYLILVVGLAFTLQIRSRDLQSVCHNEQTGWDNKQAAWIALTRADVHISAAEIGRYHLTGHDVDVANAALDARNVSHTEIRAQLLAGLGTRPTC